MPNNGLFYICSTSPGFSEAKSFEFLEDIVKTFDSQNNNLILEFSDDNDADVESGERDRGDLGVTEVDGLDVKKIRKFPKALKNKMVRNLLAYNMEYLCKEEKVMRGNVWRPTFHSNNSAADVWLSMDILIRKSSQGVRVLQGVYTFRAQLSLGNVNYETKWLLAKYEKKHFPNGSWYSCVHFIVAENIQRSKKEQEIKEARHS